MSALLATGVSVRYGGLQALREVDLEVPRGQLVGLIGPNGAGKTTFIDAITGFTPMGGRVALDGNEISSLSPDRRARAGLTRTWQAGELFDELSVVENLAVSAGRPSLRQVARELVLGRSGESEAARRALAQLELEELADAKPDELTQGQRKLVGVARALAAEPHVICLDEPAAGLDTGESGALGRHLRQVVDRGTALLLVDHDMGLVLTVCDYVVVLDFGRVIARGTPDEVRRDPAVISAYLGGAAAEVMEVA
jgi:branched-chain amino acid transport system ATP-binding protein